MEHDDGYSWLPSLGFGMLTYNSVRAIYNSNGDMGSIWCEMYQIVKDTFELPASLRKEILEVKDPSKRCLFHGFERHSTGECLQLKDILEKLARQGKLTDYIRPEFYEKWRWQYNGRNREFKKDIPFKRNTNRERQQDPPERDPERPDIRHQDRQANPVIHMISGEISDIVTPTRTGTKPYPTVLNVEGSSNKKRPRTDEVISFSSKDQGDVMGPHDDPVVLTLKIGHHRVRRILVDTGSSADILYLSAFRQMGMKEDRLQKITSSLVGFTGDTLRPRGVIRLKVTFGTAPRTTEVMVDFLVVSAPSGYNAILGRRTLNQIGAVISSSCLKIKFHTDNGVGEECGQQKAARECNFTSLQGHDGAVHNVKIFHMS